jgi:hypothetical protein
MSFNFVIILVAFCILLLSPNEGFGLQSSSNIYVGSNSRNIMMGLYDRIRSAVIRKQPDANIDRVIKCWDKFSTGNGVERYLDAPTNLVLQKADCFVEELSAMPFHKIETFPWALNLENHAGEILKELRDHNTKEAIQKQLLSDSDWLPPRDTAGSAYGPEWKTLGLQDRSMWDEDKVLEFPRTVELLKQYKVPSCEVFFAKQGVFLMLHHTK